MGDGSRLTLKEINEGDYNFNDVELLTLSACDTAMGSTGGKRQGDRGIWCIGPKPRSQRRFGYTMAGGG